MGATYPKIALKIAGLWKNDHQLGDRSPKTEGLAADGKSVRSCAAMIEPRGFQEEFNGGSISLSISLFSISLYIYIYIYIYIYSLSSICHQQNIVNIGDAYSKSFFDLHEPNGATWRLGNFCGFLKGSFPVDWLWHKKQSDRQNIKHDLPAIFFEVLESRFPNELLLLSRFINLSSNFGVSRRPSLPAGSHVEESRRWWIHPVISGHSWYFVPFVPFLWHKKPNVLLYLLLVKLKYPCCWWNPMINLTC